MKNWTFSIFVLILLLGSILSGCSGQQTDEAVQADDEQGKEKLTIYTTLFPLQDFAQKIGGEHVEVDSLIPAGADAHTYEPTTKMMMKLAEADLFIYNGAGMESYAESMAESLQAENVKILEASKEIDLKEHVHADGHEEDAHSEDEAHTEDEHGHEEDTHSEDEHGHEHGDKDPHVWLDPTLAIQLAENIKEELVSLKPEEEKAFNQNFEQLKTDLQALDHDFHDVVESAKNPKILVSHAAYGYWEQAYGLEQISIAGLSPSNEPSQKELEKIIHIAEENQIKYVIFEQNVKPKVADIIKNELNADTLQLHNLSVRTEEEVKTDEDYFSLMKQNIETLKTALN
ncbi:zinc ABC transporter substrate-binding protein [Bacillus tianshenii]|nr:zinc ABC transporter substrate-binding protein [Bacillus tianshenii]